MAALETVPDRVLALCARIREGEAGIVVRSELVAVGGVEYKHDPATQGWLRRRSARLTKEKVTYCAMPVSDRNKSRLCLSTGFPWRFKNCLGRSACILEPTPPASRMTETSSESGGVGGMAAAARGRPADPKRVLWH